MYVARPKNLQKPRTADEARPKQRWWGSLKAATTTQLLLLRFAWTPMVSAAPPTQVAQANQAQLERLERMQTAETA